MIDSDTCAILTCVCALFPGAENLHCPWIYYVLMVVSRCKMCSKTQTQLVVPLHIACFLFFLFPFFFFSLLFLLLFFLFFFFFFFVFVFSSFLFGRSRQSCIFLGCCPDHCGYRSWVGKRASGRHFLSHIKSKQGHAGDWCTRCIKCGKWWGPSWTNCIPLPASSLLSPWATHHHYTASTINIAVSAQFLLITAVSIIIIIPAIITTIINIIVLNTLINITSTTSVTTTAAVASACCRLRRSRSTNTDHSQQWRW